MGVALTTDVVTIWKNLNPATTRKSGFFYGRETRYRPEKYLWTTCWTRYDAAQSKFILRFTDICLFRSAW